LYGGIPVHRGEYDRQLLDTTMAALQSGKPLLIAPEGGRSHTPGMRRALPGVAYIVDKTDVPVVPVGLVGATDDFLQQAFHFHRPIIEMRIGKSLRLPPVEGKGAARREALQANVDQIMLHIAALVPAEYRGIYQLPAEADDDHQ
jgi:1-acyl-sn-glycerol-3-phosphate acyltransferase